MSKLFMSVGTDLLSMAYHNSCQVTSPNISASKLYPEISMT